MAMKESNLKRFPLMVFSFVCSCLPASAQIVEWLEDQIRSEIESTIYSEINKVTHYNSNELGDFGTFIWNSVVDAKRDSDLKDKARELRNFPINRSYLEKIPSKFPNNSKYWTTHSQITPILNTRANEYFHDTNDVRFCDAANASIATFTKLYIDSISTQGRKDYQEITLNQSVIDSLTRCSSTPGIIDSLKHDLTINPLLGFFLNNHPEAIRIYCNSFMVPELRRGTRHLAYWGLHADSHRHLLDKKQKLINPRELKFIPKDRGIDIILNNDAIGNMVNNLLYVYNINIMNLLGKPNTTYLLDSNQWTTDEYGRVVKAEQKYGKSYKGKCKQKSSLNIKKAKNALSSAPYTEIGYFNQPDYGGPEVLLNTYFYEKTSDNKTALKNVNKSHKASMKKSDSDTSATAVEYCNHQALPAAIIIDYNRMDRNQVNNSGLTRVNKETTKPEIKNFDKSNKKRSHQAKQIDIVKQQATSSTVASSQSKQASAKTSKSSIAEFGITTFCEPLSKQTHQTADALGISKSVFNKIQSMKSQEKVISDLLKAGFTCTSKKNETVYDESIGEYDTYIKATLSKPVAGSQIIVKEDWGDTTIIFPNASERDKFLATIKAEEAKGRIFTTNEAYWVGVRIETEGNKIRLVAQGG